MTINADAPKPEEKVRKVGERTLREVMVKIGLERIDMQEGIMVEALLDSRATRIGNELRVRKKAVFQIEKTRKTDEHEKHR